MGQASLQTPSACVVRIRVPPESRKNQTQGACLQMLFTPLHFLRRKSLFPWPPFPHLFNLSNTHPRIALGGEKAGLLEKQPLLLSFPRPCSSSARFLLSGWGASPAVLCLKNALVGVCHRHGRRKRERRRQGRHPPPPGPRPSAASSAASPAAARAPARSPPCQPPAPRARPGDPAAWSRAPGSRSAQAPGAGAEQAARGGSHAAPAWRCGRRAQVTRRHGAGGLQGAVPVAVRLQDREVCHRQEQEGGPALPAAAGLHPDLPGGVSSPGAFGEALGPGTGCAVPVLGKGLLGVRGAGEEGAHCLPHWLWRR